MIRVRALGRPRPAVLVLLSLGSLVTPSILPRASAQGAGAVIAGTVTDRQNDSAVEGAVVLLEGTLLHARTGERGQFRLAVPAGTYTLTVLALGYSPDSLAGLTVADGETRDVTVALARAPVGLSDVVVTASRTPQRAEESGASVSVLPGEGLVRRNVTTLDQALIYEPGVTINGGQMDIRGSTGLARGVGSRVLLMLDGHPILSGDGGEIDFESMPLARRGPRRGGPGGLLGAVRQQRAGRRRQRADVLRRQCAGNHRTGALRRVAAARSVSLHDRPVDEKGFGMQHSRRLGNRSGPGSSSAASYRTATARTTRTSLASAREAGVAGRNPPIPGMRTRCGRAKTTGSSSSGAPTAGPTKWTPPPATTTRSTTSSSPARRHADRGRGHAAAGQPVRQLQQRAELLPTTTIQPPPATRLGGTIDLSLRPGDRHAFDLGIDVAHTVVASNFLGPAPHQRRRVVRAGRSAPVGAVGGSLGGRLDYHDATDGRPEWSPSPKLGVTFRPRGLLATHVSVAHGFRSPERDRAVREHDPVRHSRGSQPGPEERAGLVGGDRGDRHHRGPRAGSPRCSRANTAT